MNFSNISIAQNKSEPVKSDPQIATSAGLEKANNDLTKSNIEAVRQRLCVQSNLNLRRCAERFGKNACRQSKRIYYLKNI
jgi:hypothetical protein